ncbi:MAG: diadenylate cyclase CdaA [Bacteroidota bacterium]
MGIALFEIGFLPVRIWDILDILIVGFLMYQIYKLLRGSIAFNIFIGVILIFVVWWLVGVLKMDLLSSLLSQFVSVGVIMLLIIFQPEVRRFLLLLGNSTLRQRSNFLSSLLDRNIEVKEGKQQHIQEIKKAMLRMSRQKTGALIVLSRNTNVEVFSNSGVLIGAQISQPLIESIFNKDSPLHDGAMIISGGKIRAASCVLPISASQGLPKSAGLRHRAAVGVSESSEVAAFIVSEENGKISMAFEGKLHGNLDETKLTERLMEHYA